MTAKPLLAMDALKMLPRKWKSLYIAHRPTKIIYLLKLTKPWERIFLSFASVTVSHGAIVDSLLVAIN